MRLKARPVVALDRTLKARMIDALVADATGAPVEARRVLDIGCGNGDIAAHFAERNTVCTLDIVDQRRNQHRTLAHCIGASEQLPYADQYFDLALSNHVVEHVQSHDAHLQEIFRVLKPGGVCFLATPNGTSPFMRGHIGNPMVLKHAQMKPLFESCGFDVEECYTRWLHQPIKFHCPTRIGALFPTFVLQLMSPWYPSQNFLLTRPSL